MYNETYITQILETQFRVLMTEELNILYLSQIFDNLRTQYSDNGNSYHNLYHIYECVVNELPECVTLLHNPAACALALYYHDVIYVPQKKNNEIFSSVYLYNEMIRFGIRSDDLLHAVLLIQSTDYSLKYPYFDEDQFYIHDIDHAILGYNWNRFMEYENSIALEYQKEQHLKLYLDGRIKFLNMTMQDDIYYTNIFKNKYEHNALANMTRLIAKLEEELYVAV